MTSDDGTRAAQKVPTMADSRQDHQLALAWPAADYKTFVVGD